MKKTHERDLFIEVIVFYIIALISIIGTFITLILIFITNAPRFFYFLASIPLLDFLSVEGFLIYLLITGKYLEED